jgi:uncharacterized protein YdeI (YjbR/CyaY-like superfamily)
MGFVDDDERIEVPDAATWRAWLEDNHAARANEDAFPLSARKYGLQQIALAKRPETRAARIAKIVAGAAEGRRP